MAAHVMFALVEACCSEDKLLRLKHGVLSDDTWTRSVLDCASSVDLPPGLPCVETLLACFAASAEGFGVGMLLARRWLSASATAA